MTLPTKTAEYFIPKYEGIDNLTYRESSLESPKASEVLVRIHAVSLNYRDIAVATGHYPAGVKPEVVPCSDMAGEVVSVGDNVKNWKRGDRVMSNFSLDHLFGDPTVESMNTALGAPIDGVLTQYKNFPAHALVRIPRHMSYEEASTLPCAALTAWNAFQGHVPLKGGDTVLVQGTGGVSIFGLQIAAAMGATVIVTSSSDTKLQLAKQLGATHLINYKTHPDWDKEALNFTEGRGVDHILEVGGTGTLAKSFNAVRMGGSIHTIGFLAAGDNANDIALKVIVKAAVYRGILIGSRSQFEDMNRLLEARQIRPVVDKVFPFDQAKQAYEYLASQKHVGKVVIKVSD